MNLQRAVAFRISKLLIKNGNMSQYQLAIKSGLTKQAVSNIMNEKYKSLKFETIVKLADGFGITLQEFLNDEFFKRDKLDID